MSNFLSLLMESFWTQVITACYLLYAARIVGPDGFGEFSFIMAIITISSVFVRLGMQLVVTREVAISDADTGHRVVQSALLMTLLSSTMGVVLISAVGWLIPRLHANFTYLLLALISMALTMEMGLINAYFKGAKRMAIPSAILVLQVLTKAMIGITLLWCGFSVLSLFLALVISSALATAIAGGAYRWYSGCWPTPAARGKSKLLVKDGGQIAAAQLTSAAFNRFDWIFLGSLKTSAVLGTYSAAYRLFEIIITVSGIMITSAFPSLCQSEQRGDGNRKQLLLATKLMILPGCLAMVFLFFWARPIILLVLGLKFASAVNVLQLLSVSIPFHGGCGLFYHISLAKRRQRYLLWSSATCATTNIILCLFFIPRWGGLGAAMAMLIPSIIQFFLLSWIAQQLANLGPALWYALRTIIVVGCLSGLVYMIPMPWVLEIILACILIVPILWLWGGLNKEEKQVLGNIWGRFIYWNNPTTQEDTQIE